MEENYKRNVFAAGSYPDTLIWLTDPRIRNRMRNIAHYIFSLELSIMPTYSGVP
jgi:hypothetical protein